MPVLQFDASFPITESDADRFDVPRSNLKVAFTEHEGADTMGYDRIYGPWTSEEDS